jgi:hypothetical protein
MATLYRLVHYRFDPLRRGYTSPAQPRGLDDAGALLKLGADLLDLVPRQRLLSDWFPAFGAVDTRSREPSLDPAPNDRPLEFGEDAEHLEHGPSRWRGRVEGLLMQIQIAPGTIGAPRGDR